ncbi:MAG: GNAT family N-acetyltransferase [Treponema sp.]|nr:GNAT family N-acetyltransferase [Treponema sp.]
MEDINIRKAVLSDLPYLYEICLKTGDNGKDATDLYFDPYLIGNYFAAPYLLFPDCICFVVEYKYRPQGYIIAAPDSTAFHKWLEEQWLPPLRIRFPKPYSPDIIRSDKEKWILDQIHEKCFPVDQDDLKLYAEYPAHLHIDMLPCLQGKGLGRTLTDTLFAELKQRGVTGLHLGVSSSNAGAVAFYQKLGFSVLKEHDWGFTMGKLCN